MKKYIILAFLFSGVLAAAQAEQVSSISFNPSRLGLYQQLRVTKQVESSGNLTAGTTYVKGDTTASANSYEIVNVNAQKGTVDMRGGETEMVVNGKMNIKGGKAQFTAASTLPQLPTNTWIKADEGGLTMGEVQVDHPLTDRLKTKKLFNFNDEIHGLKLGNNDIPLAPSECTGALDWVERKAGDNSIYQVLAVKGCGNASCDKTESSCQIINSNMYLCAKQCECRMNQGKMVKKTGDPLRFVFATYNGKCYTVSSKPGYATCWSQVGDDNLVSSSDGTKTALDCIKEMGYSYPEFFPTTCDSSKYRQGCKCSRSSSGDFLKVDAMYEYKTNVDPACLTDAPSEASTASWNKVYYYEVGRYNCQPYSSVDPDC